MRFSLEQTYGIVTRCTACRDTVNVQTQAWTYGQCVVGKPYFHQLSHSSYFPYFRVVLVELGLIEGISTDLESSDLSEFSEMLFDPSEF